MSLTEYLEERLGSVFIYTNEPIKVGIGIPSELSKGAAAGVGYSVLWKEFNSLEGVYCGLFFSDSEPGKLVGTDIGVADCDIILMSYCIETMEIGAIKLLRKSGVPVFSQFIEEDTLLYNLLLRRVPVKDNRRSEGSPLVIFGGMGVNNPESVSAFMDAAVIGTGEDFAQELIGLYRQYKGDKSDLLKALSTLEGVYVPSFYIDQGFRRQSNTYRMIPNPEITDIKLPTEIQARAFKDIDNRPAFGAIPVPDSNRISGEKELWYLELVRGCFHGCINCAQGEYSRDSGFLQPETLKSLTERMLHEHPDTLIRLVLPSSRNREYTEQIFTVLDGKPIRVGSLRADDLSEREIEIIAKSGQQKLSIAPETTQRTRREMGKSIKDQDIKNVVMWASKYGLPYIQLDTLLGVPGETDATLWDYACFLSELNKISKENGNTQLIVEANQIYPRPGTAFGYMKALTYEEALAKYNLLKENGDLMGSSLTYWSLLDTYPFMSTLQPILSRGGRELLPVIYEMSLTDSVEKEFLISMIRNWVSDQKYYDEWEYYNHPSSHIKPLSAQHGTFQLAVSESRKRSIFGKANIP